MSKRELQLAFCEGKDALPTWERGRRAAKAMTKAKKGQSMYFEPYRCKFCGAIHVGSVDKVTKLRKPEKDLDVPGYPGHENEVVW
jgi:hypothetical protein